MINLCHNAIIHNATINTNSLLIYCADFTGSPRNWFWTDKSACWTCRGGVSAKGLKTTPFQEKPGYDWWVGFMKRWPRLAERKPQHLPRKRAERANYETIRGFFDSDLRILHAHYLADRLWNCDESG